MAGIAEVLTIALSLGQLGMQLIQEGQKIMLALKDGEPIDLEEIRSRRARLIAQIVADESTEAAAFKSHAG